MVGVPTPLVDMNLLIVPPPPLEFDVRWEGGDYSCQQIFLCSIRFTIRTPHTACFYDKSHSAIYQSELSALALKTWPFYFDVFSNHSRDDKCYFKMFYSLTLLEERSRVMITTVFSWRLYPVTTISHSATQLTQILNVM